MQYIRGATLLTWWVTIMMNGFFSLEGEAQTLVDREEQWKSKEKLSETDSVCGGPDVLGLDQTSAGPAGPRRPQITPVCSPFPPDVAPLFLRRFLIFGKTWNAIPRSEHDELFQVVFKLVLLSTWRGSRCLFFWKLSPLWKTREDSDPATQNCDPGDAPCIQQVVTAN